MNASMQISSEKDLLAILKLPLAETLPAYALKEILDTLVDLQFSYLWLSLAESYSGPQLFPDEYAPTEDETLFILELEVGTPNFLTLIGDFTSLVPVLGAIASFLGIGYTTVNLIKGGLEIKEKKLDIKIKQQQLRKLLKEAEKDEQNQKAQQIDVTQINFNLSDVARELYQGNKISQKALNHKMEIESHIQENAPYFFQNYAGLPKFYLISQSETDDEIPI